MPHVRHNAKHKEAILVFTMPCSVPLEFETERIDPAFHRWMDRNRNFSNRRGHRGLEGLEGRERQRGRLRRRRREGGWRGREEEEEEEEKRRQTHRYQALEGRRITLQRKAMRKEGEEREREPDCVSRTGLGVF